MIILDFRKLTNDDINRSSVRTYHIITSRRPDNSFIPRVRPLTQNRLSGAYCISGFKMGECE